MRLSDSSFKEADEWNYDVYAYNAVPALQAILAGNILQMEHPLGEEFQSVEKEILPAGRHVILTPSALTDSEIRTEELRAAVWDEERRGPCLRVGIWLLPYTKEKFISSRYQKGRNMWQEKGSSAFGVPVSILPGI